MKKQEIAPLPPLDANQRYTVVEAAAYLRQSVSKTYMDAQSGRLASFQDGRRRYIPGAELIKRSRCS